MKVLKFSPVVIVVEKILMEKLWDVSILDCNAI
jgi:hypothetical protein